MIRSLNRIISSSFRDGRLALGDELVNISGKRFDWSLTPCPYFDHQYFDHLWDTHKSYSKCSRHHHCHCHHPLIFICTLCRLRGLPREKAATIIAEAGRFVKHNTQTRTRIQEGIWIQIQLQIQEGTQTQIQSQIAEAGRFLTVSL